MAKKKSKTQKYKKNVKRKAKKIQNSLQNTNIVEQVIEKKVLNKEVEEPKKDISKKSNSLSPKENTIKKNTSSKTGAFKKKIKENKNDEIILPKLKKNIKKEDIKKKKNIFIRLLYELKNNSHIIFNALLIIIFIILITGILRIEVFKTGTIIYIAIIILFLMAVAISYNKYISGKIFTVLLCIGMSYAIYHMQYTYDFIRNLNTSVYEYKTYYVVAFDNIQNKSIYTINNKNVGLLKDNCINVERRLNTKLDKVTYSEYDDINTLFDDFYEQKYRAILVNENQYKYLQNNIQNNQEVKILYEFKANARK